MKRILFVICFSALLSACASTPRGAQKAAFIAACPQGSSIIKNWAPSLSIYTSETNIMAVPGLGPLPGLGVRFCMPEETEISTACKPINGPPALLYCMPSGINTISVGVMYKGRGISALAEAVTVGPLFMDDAAELLIISLQPGRMYEFRSHYKPEGFLITIVDVDVDSEKTAHEFILPVRKMANPNKPRDLTVPAQQ